MKTAEGGRFDEDEDEDKDKEDEEEDEGRLFIVPRDSLTRASQLPVLAICLSVRLTRVEP